MNKIILIKRNKHLPDDFETKDFGLYILSRFLVKDLYTHTEDYLDWLKNPEHAMGGNNITLFHEKGKIEIRDSEWDMDDPEEDNDLFETTTNELIDIIHQWTDLLKSDPEAVLIEQDDAGKITMKAVPRKTEL